MMLLADRLALHEVFRQIAATKRRELRDIEFMEELSEDRKRDAEREKEDREFFAEFQAAAVEQIAAFESRLEAYDTAIVNALMENERELDEARKHIEALESKAYKAPDGMSVFKTADGKHVFNGKGSELSREIIDPALIPDSNPTWESRQAAGTREEKLLLQRDELHDFQKKVDDAHRAIEKDGVSTNELADLRSELERAEPTTIREQLSGHALDQTGEPQKHFIGTPASGIQSMRPNGF